MSEEINNQYDFFKKVNLDEEGNIGVSLIGGGEVNNNFTNDEKIKLSGIQDNATSTVIVDNLITNESDKALSASQGVILQTQISGLVGAVILRGSFIAGGVNAAIPVRDDGETIIAGDGFTVTEAGNFLLGTIDDWGINDMAVKTTGGWTKIDNTESVRNDLTGELETQTALSAAQGYELDNKKLDIATYDNRTHSDWKVFLTRSVNAADIGWTTITGASNYIGLIGFDLEYRGDVNGLDIRIKSQTNTNHWVNRFEQTSDAVTSGPLPANSKFESVKLGNIGDTASLIFNVKNFDISHCQVSVVNSNSTEFTQEGYHFEIKVLQTGDSIKSVYFRQDGIERY